MVVGRAADQRPQERQAVRVAVSVDQEGRCVEAEESIPFRARHTAPGHVACTRRILRESRGGKRCK